MRMSNAKELSRRMFSRGFDWSTREFKNYDKYARIKRHLKREMRRFCRRRKNSEKE